MGSSIGRRLLRAYHIDSKNILCIRFLSSVTMLYHPAMEGMFLCLKGQPASQSEAIWSFSGTRMPISDHMVRCLLADLISGAHASSLRCSYTQTRDAPSLGAAAVAAETMKLLCL